MEGDIGGRNKIVGRKMFEIFYNFYFMNFIDCCIGYKFIFVL